MTVIQKNFWTITLELDVDSWSLLWVINRNNRPPSCRSDTPITGIARCCARAASGHAVATRERHF
jgi:hypothetical protein